MIESIDLIRFYIGGSEVREYPLFWPQILMTILMGLYDTVFHHFPWMSLRFLQLYFGGYASIYFKKYPTDKLDPDGHTDYSGSHGNEKPDPIPEMDPTSPSASISSRTCSRLNPTLLVLTMNRLYITSVRSRINWLLLRLLLNFKYPLLMPSFLVMLVPRLLKIVHPISLSCNLSFKSKSFPYSTKTSSNAASMRRF